MKLHMTLRSPFARRVRLALRRAKIKHEEIHTDVFNPTAEFLRTQPLATVPYVILETGEVIPDSQTILEYLEARFGGGFIPLRTHERVASTYAVGLMTATVAWLLEGQRAQPSKEFQDEQVAIITRTIGALSNLSQTLGEGQAFWDAAVALEYLTFRMPDFDWQKRHHALVPVLERARLNPDFVETKPRNN